VVAYVFSVLNQLSLALRLQALVPALAPAAAYADAVAANRAATAHVRPELLLAVAFVESRYDPTATSWVSAGDGVRHTGHYAGTAPPARLDPHASLYCGPLQTYAASWSACLRLRDLDIAYAAGARELEQWLRDRRVHGNVLLALAGHGCGNLGVATGRCNGYPERVAWLERRLSVRPAIVRAGS